MRLWSGSTLVQIMACRLDGTKPLSEPMLTYYQLDPEEHISMKFYLKFKYFHSSKCIWTCLLRNGDHFVQGEMSWLSRMNRSLFSTRKNYTTFTWSCIDKWKKICYIAMTPKIDSAWQGLSVKDNKGYSSFITWGTHICGDVIHKYNEFMQSPLEIISRWWSFCQGLSISSYH